MACSLRGLEVDPEDQAPRHIESRPGSYQDVCVVTAVINSSDRVLKAC